MIPFRTIRMQYPQIRDREIDSEAEIEIDKGIDRDIEGQRETEEIERGRGRQSMIDRDREGQRGIERSRERQRGIERDVKSQLNKQNTNRDREKCEHPIK